MSDSTSWRGQHDPLTPRPADQLDDLLAGHRLAERKRRRREVPSAGALIVFGGAGVVFGPGVPLATFVAGWIVGAGIFFLIGRALRNRHERGDGPRGRLVTSSVRGEPATVMRQHLGREWVAAGFVVYLGLIFAIGGWFAVVDSSTTSVLVLLISCSSPSPSPSPSLLVICRPWTKGSSTRSQSRGAIDDSASSPMSWRCSPLRGA